MKLNEKGQKKLIDYAFQCKKNKSVLCTEMPEFELEDFMTEKKWPTIELQLYEAKEFLSWLRNSQWKHKHQCNFEFTEYWRKDMFNCLNERIIKAEDKNESN